MAAIIAVRARRGSNRHAACLRPRAETGGRVPHSLRFPSGAVRVSTGNVENDGEGMAVHMVKVAYEGPGDQGAEGRGRPTSGGSVIYAIEDVPAGSPSTT